jgi:hypothetical protein
VNTVLEVARIARWSSDITARRGRGEEIPAGELLDYQRAKVALLATLAERDPSPNADEVLAEARAQLADMESAGLPIREASTTELEVLADQEHEARVARAEYGPTSTDGDD